MPFEKEIIESLTASVAEQVHDAVYRNAPTIFADLAKALTDDPDGGMVKATIKLGFYGYAATKAAAGVESMEWERKVKNTDKDFQLLRLDLEQPDLPGIDDEGGPDSGSDAVGNFKGHIAAMEKKYDCKITFDAGPRHVEVPAKALDSGIDDLARAWEAQLDKASKLLQGNAVVSSRFLVLRMDISRDTADGLLADLRARGFIGPQDAEGNCRVIAGALPRAARQQPHDAGGLTE